MSERLRWAVAPFYLLLCLLLGGSAQGMWGNAILQSIAIAFIAWALIDPPEQPLGPTVRTLLWLAGGALLLIVIHLIPLPAQLWTRLPGRELVADGFGLLGMAIPAMPLTLDSSGTVVTALAMLPALGMLAAMIRFPPPTAWLAAALIAGASAGVLLGILQVGSSDPANSPWYFYRRSNFGNAIGFFANSNHMASLLLAVIPFLAAIGAAAREAVTDRRKKSAVAVLIGGGMVMVILGLLLNKSLAGYGIGVPVLLASLALLLGPRSRVGKLAMVATLVAVVGALLLVWSRPVVGPSDLGVEASVSTRQTIAAQSVDLVRQYGPVGSGLGTFDKVYRLAEDPASVDLYFVNHAHNDYLELAVELGLPGIALMLLFVTWWALATWRMIRSPASDGYAQAGAIASAAILLHSLVDYPLRTAAISSLFALCLLLIVRSRRSARSDNDLRPARHLVVG